MSRGSCRPTTTQAREIAVGGDGEWPNVATAIRWHHTGERAGSELSAPPPTSASIVRRSLMTGSLDPEAFPLPLTVDDITAQWLTAALRQSQPGVTVTDFRELDRVEGTATKVLVELDYQFEGAAGRPSQPDLGQGWFRRPP